MTGLLSSPPCLPELPPAPALPPAPVLPPDPVAKGKVLKSSGGGGGGGNGGSGGGKKKSEACRICKSKSHKTKDCDKRAGTSCRQWQEKGVCSFGDECVHEHKESEKGQTNTNPGASVWKGTVCCLPSMSFNLNSGITSVLPISVSSISTCSLGSPP